VNILLLSSERAWGGGEEQLRLLAMGLAERGHQVAVACRHGSEFARRAAQHQIEAFSLVGHPRGVRAIWQVRRWIASHRPDVVHANDAHAATLLRWATWQNRRVGRVASRRVVFPIRSPARYRRGADRVLCVSQAIATVAESSGIPASQLAVVYDGIDLGRMAVGDRQIGRQKLDVEGHQTVVLMVASLVECKGHSILLEAVARLRASHPNLCVVLAGEGDQRPSIEQQIAALELTPCVKLLGFRSDVPDLMQAADLVVLPSLDEGLGTSAIDALAAGKPVVTTTAGGLPEVMRNAATGELHGWLVAPGDAVALAGAVAQALAQPDVAARRTAAGHAFVHQHFSAAAMVEATLAEYAEILQQNSSATP
jgi:glycosyltransferase involved in cell wall biosynthesis